LEMALRLFNVECVNLDLVLGIDIADDTLWESTRRDMLAGVYGFVLSSFPCKSSAVSRHRSGRLPGPRPLRSLDKIWGFSGLHGADKELVRIGNLLASRSGEACRIISSIGGGFAVEQPRAWEGLPSLLLLPPILALDDLGATDVHFDQCPFGSKSAKPTTIKFKGGSFGTLASHVCDHPVVTWSTDGQSYSAAHPRLAGTKDKHGKFATEDAQFYPDKLNFALGKCIANFFGSTPDDARLGSAGDPAIPTT
jgi:hypothetical protein